jgi:hypothetical protein
MRKIQFLLMGLVVCSAQAQLQVDFENETLGTSPDQFTPAWSGNASLFTLVSDGGSQRLRSNAGQLGSSTTYYISTPSESIDDTIWEFFIQQKFATSGANYTEIHLVADNANLMTYQNGYFVRIGETADRIAFYSKISGTVSSALLASPGGITENKAFKIRVTRDDIGNWTLEYDEGATGTYVSAGSVLENSVTTTTHFGILILQSNAAGPANNHFFDNIFVGTDTQGPIISSATALSSTQVDVLFNEPLDEATAETISNYALNFGVDVTGAELDGTNPALVHLTTSTLANGLTYTLTVNNVEDVNGNAIVPNSTIDFAYLVISTAGWRDIVINEFMADPAPPVGLPETDFVELYNPTDKFFNLSGWRIANNTGQSGTISSYVLAPGGYLIVCPTTFVSQFEVFGDVRGVTSFPNFTHTTPNAVVLLNNSGQEIDRVNYTTAGLPIDGVTYEQVNPLLICSGQFNFKRSEGILGGTPGEENSVFMIVPDNFGPNITMVRALSADSIRIDFNETINSAQVPTSTYVIEPVISVAQKFYLPAYSSSVFLKLGSALTPNVTYTVTVSGISDCSGNAISGNTGSFVLGVSPESDDILLSEVLFHPRTGGVDFVEIYNASPEKNFELRGWKLARLVNGNIDSPRPIAPDGLLMKPNELLVFTTNPTNIAIEYPLGNPAVYIQLPSLPSYNNSDGIVLLLNAADEIVQRFDYRADYHYGLLKTKAGVSLERVSYTSEVNDKNNWRSAASTVGFATPGRPNSQSIELGGGGQLTIEPKVFLPGNSGTGRDFTTINYSFNEPGKFANIMIYDQTGRPVKQLANGASLAISGFFRWDGTTDKGGMARMGYYVVVFEVYDGRGNKNLLRETVVVGRDF